MNDEEEGRGSKETQNIDDIIYGCPLVIFDINFFSRFQARDLMVLCQLFFLPADHGAVGLQLLEDFFWLKRNANSMIPPGTPGESTHLKIKLLNLIPGF